MCHNKLHLNSSSNLDAGSEISVKSRNVHFLIKIANIFQIETVAGI